jgi:CTP-dependent riboflavin kinase
MSGQRVLETIRGLAGFGVVPGTLNVRLPQRFNTPLRNYISSQELGIHVEAPGFYYAPIIIAGRFKGLLLRSTEPGYPADLVELVSECNLRSALSLKDGDQIEFALAEGFSAEVQDKEG